MYEWHEISILRKKNTIMRLPEVVTLHIFAIRAAVEKVDIRRRHFQLALDHRHEGDALAILSQQQPLPDLLRLLGFVCRLHLLSGNHLEIILRKAILNEALSDNIFAQLQLEHTALRYFIIIIANNIVSLG